MSEFLNRNLTAITILGSLALGFFLPDLGMLFRPYVSYLLMLLMFLTALTVRPEDFLKSARDTKAVGFALFMIFVFVPVLAFLIKPLFSPMAFIGIMLASCAPAAVSTAFYSSFFNGDKAYGLVISITANLLAVITVPFTMFLAIGDIISIDPKWMLLNLAPLTFVPILLAFIIQKILKTEATSRSEYTSKTSLVVLLFIIWGSIAAATSYIQENPVQFLYFNIFTIVFLSITFGITFLLGKRYGFSRAITAGVGACFRNLALPLVIAAMFFNSEVFSPLMAYLIAHSVMLIALKVFFKEK